MRYEKPILSYLGQTQLLVATGNALSKPNGGCPDGNRGKRPATGI